MGVSWPKRGTFFKNPSRASILLKDYLNFLKSGLFLVKYPHSKTALTIFIKFKFRNSP